MKLVINYDLMNEIVRANRGFDVKKFSKKMGTFMGFVGVTSLTIANPLFFAWNAIYGTLLYGGTELIFKNITKQNADMKLNILASSLKKINIYTDIELIKKAYLYKTQFKVIHDDKAYLQQNKFIMLPTNGSLNADEVSLLQEHIVGSNEYILSIGSPKKTFKKISSGVLAR